MTEFGCEKVRELIPLLAAEAVEGQDERAVQAHLEACDECRAEAELAAALFHTRVQPPADLAHRIKASVRVRPRVARRPWWGLSAAAVAVLALGIGVVQQDQPDAVSVPVYAAENTTGDLWLSDDGFVAGAPTLESLSDEALEQLLNEMGTGGAA